jgi:hypothetical protein
MRMMAIAPIRNDRNKRTGSASSVTVNASGLHNWCHESISTLAQNSCSGVYKPFANSLLIGNNVDNQLSIPELLGGVPRPCSRSYVSASPRHCMDFASRALLESNQSTPLHPWTSKGGGARPMAALSSPTTPPQPVLPVKPPLTIHALASVILHARTIFGGGDGTLRWRTLSFSKASL